MPGSIFELRCPGCEAIHRLETGESVCMDHGEPWRFEQWICPRCRALVSRSSSSCCREESSGRHACGTPLRRWGGRVWLEDSAEGFPVERVEGPCPRCQTTVSEADMTGLIGLWD